MAMGKTSMKGDTDAPPEAPAPAQRDEASTLSS
jgi:hypothetical protein